MPDENQIVGEIHVGAGATTEAHYGFTFKPASKCVVTEMFAVWEPSVVDADIKAFLYGSGSRVGLPPVPNYRVFYGPKAGSTCPLMALFDLRSPRLRSTHPAFDPLTVPVPLAFDKDTFEIALEGTPVTAKSDFGIIFLVTVRPLNT
jgi:hypothetical protein